MTQFGGNGFRELGDKLDRLAEHFETKTQGTTGAHGKVGRDPETGNYISPDGAEPKRRIGTGISRAMRRKDGGIVTQARNEASQYVPNNEEQTIQHRQVDWDFHRFYSTSDMVSYHEFGTSTQANDQSRATRNAPGGNGYIIPSEKYETLPVGPDDFPQALDQLPVDVDFVVHPGVEERSFMRDALRRNVSLIEDEVAAQLEKAEFRI